MQISEREKGRNPDSVAEPSLQASSLVCAFVVLETEPRALLGSGIQIQILMLESALPLSDISSLKDPVIANNKWYQDTLLHTPNVMAWKWAGFPGPRGREQTVIRVRTFRPEEDGGQQM